jgi:hypothetical protein
MDSDKITQFQQMIANLSDQYKCNPYIIQRIDSHLSKFPELLVKINNDHNDRVNKMKKLMMEQDNFCNIFLSKHKYYFMSHNNMFYEYDNKTYKPVKEDDIYYTLLSTITSGNKTLMPWKQRTATMMMKKIKERSLFTSIPETYTIQHVLSFLNTFFQSKHESKYFLTIIGDCILRKSTDNLYFISSNLKQFISLIEIHSCVVTGVGTFNNFITKHSEKHKLNNYRIINTIYDTNTMTMDLIKNMFSEISIDLLCIAVHYSERYGSAENFLNTKLAEEPIRDTICYFVNNSIENIVDNFIKTSIEKVDNINMIINEKNMYYIWKLYLSTINVPNVTYSIKLVTMLGNKLPHYASEKGGVVFRFVTSPYLPKVSSFLTFWNKHISISKDDNDEYEIDELLYLYKISSCKNTYISDTEMLRMIKHYYSHAVKIIDDKYVTNVRCNLWSKNDDIDEFLNNYNGKGLISTDDLYNSYKSYFKAKEMLNNNTNYLLTSKQYFEKNVLKKMMNDVECDNFIQFV